LVAPTTRVFWESSIGNKGVFLPYTILYYIYYILYIIILINYIYIYKEKISLKDIIFGEDEE